MENELIKVACTADVAPGTCLPVQKDGEAILVINLNGEFHAVSARCPHEDVSLHLGAIQGDCIKCPLHGSRFNIKTGAVLDEPAESDLKTWPVTLSGDDILISVTPNPATS